MAPSDLTRERIALVLGPFGMALLARPARVQCMYQSVVHVPERSTRDMPAI